MKLYLFTNLFPFKNGEPFLETEINYLAKTFDEVIVYPLVKGEERSLVDLPSNVRVADVPTDWGALSGGVKKNIYTIVKLFGYELIFGKDKFMHLVQWKFNLYELLSALGKARFLEKNLQGGNVYYSYWFNEWANGLSLVNRKKVPGKYIGRMHGYDFDRAQNSRGYFGFRSSFITKWNQVFQVSKYGLGYVQREFKLANTIGVRYLGVRDNGLGPIGKDATYTIVSCSNFVALKRLNLIVETLQNLEVNFKWYHFGDGLGKNQIEDLAAGILPKNSFEFKGQIRNTDLMEFYAKHAVDVFINMSALEGLPVSLMEAISFGIPIVGCAICGVPEIVNAQTGLLLEKNFDVQQAAMQLETLLRQKSRNVEFRQGVRDFYLAFFNAEKNYENFATELRN